MTPDGFVDFWIRCAAEPIEYDLSAYLDQLQMINNLETELLSLSDHELKTRITELRAHSEDRLVETFAMVRECSRRTLGMRHFDVQIAGEREEQAHNASRLAAIARVLEEGIHSSMLIFGAILTRRCA